MSFPSSPPTQGSPDTYAVMTLYDPNRLPIPNIEYRTGVCVCRGGIARCGGLACV